MIQGVMGAGRRGAAGWCSVPYAPPVRRSAARTALAATGNLPLRFGLTPVFLDSDTDLLAALERYLTSRLARPVALVKRRTYQEITTLLMTGQLDAAWICGFPYVQFRSQLALVAVPLYRRQPLYQSYVIVHESDPAADLDGLRGQVHAFSDPDSNSGFLVTRYLLATMKETPASFFRRSFFTYRISSTSSSSPTRTAR